MLSSSRFDVVIVGAGVIGLAVARALMKRGFRNIIVFEKEDRLGVHTSGRNSGVLHAGIYYAHDSLKARFCREGARQWKEFAREHRVPVENTGKVIVASCDSELAEIRPLYERAIKNGVNCELISADQLRELEPEACSFSTSIFSPDTSVIDSNAALHALEEELAYNQVKVWKGKEVVSIDTRMQNLKLRSGEVLSYGHLINAAGIHADRIAHQMQVGRQYSILPFKGIYRKLRPDVAQRFKRSIYPVPDLRVPFLGVHTTKNVFGDVYVGPTAIPALGRENYGLCDHLRPGESLRMLRDLGLMFLRNTDGIRNLIAEELSRYTKSGFFKAAKRLIPNLEIGDLLPASKVGLRAQLIDEAKMKLVMDFLVEDGPSSTHILNAVSPAFTSAFPFADFVAEKVVASKASMAEHNASAIRS